LFQLNSVSSCAKNSATIYLQEPLFSNTDHLLNSLRQDYKISVDWAGSDYCGLYIKWNYAKNYVDISMPGYIASTLERLQHPRPARPQHALHQWTQPAYGQKLQLAPINETPKLEKTGIHFVQSCVGSRSPLLCTRCRCNNAPGYQ
jgi:hypothetical protein